MSITVSKKSGPAVLGSIGHAAIFKLTPDASWLAAGEAIDLTDYFSEIHYASVASCTVISGYKFDVIIPADGTDIEATTVKITAHESTDGGSAAAAMTAVPDETNLSSLAELRLLVIGKLADPS